MDKNTQSPPHDSAQSHLTGKSAYFDDIKEPEGTLHMALGLAEIAAGEIVKMDLSAVQSAEGVLLVITQEDIPNDADISAVHAHDEPILAKNKISYHSQPIFAVVAQNRALARKAARLAQIEYREAAPILNLDDAQKNGRLVTEGAKFERGSVDQALQNSKHKIKTRFDVGGQEHFYLEGQGALVIPEENNELVIHSSTQNPTEVQHLLASLLGIMAADITIITRRLGGGFGGKETQPVIFAGLAAIAARKLGKPIKIRLDRDEDFAITGKRHDFRLEYEAGFDDQGHIHAVDGVLSARCGYAADLSGPVTDRALFHADNAYFYDHVRLVSKPLFTNTASNTAFRGFGGPQGVIMAENLVDDIAAHLDEDPLTIRLRNFYGQRGNITPYHQQIRDEVGKRIIEELAEDCNYQTRRAEILEFNQKNRTQKKGIAITPVKFGISFTATFFNQAGAQALVYKDGSVQLNHGGIEMGQGLNIKMKQIAASEFGIALDRVLVSATNTSKVPNTSATAASSGSDLNGKAVENAIQTIKSNIAGFLAEKWHVRAIDVQFLGGKVFAGEHHSLSWEDAVSQAYFARVPLFAGGFYKTPDIHWDREAGQGDPFYYFAYGAACSEVLVDRYTGDYKITQVDILHDVGTSLNTAIDLGQVEGGFVQGLGWLTREELIWDQKGVLRTHAPSTYKIPLASDIPEHFSARLVDWNENFRPTIRRSKAVGEPPFCLAISAFLALKMAVRSVGTNPIVHLDAPATPERVLMAMDARDGGL